MAEADLMLEVAVVVLHTPAHVGNIDELAELHFPGDGREPVFGGLGLTLGPLDEQKQPLRAVEKVRGIREPATIEAPESVF
jgi:hypothetical protein